MVVETYPLSPIQEGMLFRALGSAAGVNVEQLVLVLPEVVDEAALLAAWRAVIARHAVLRTRFAWGDSTEPGQEVLATVELPITLLDWRTLSAANRERAREQLLTEERARGLDLRTAPLFRLHLARVADDESWLVWTRFHGILDGRATQLVLTEVFSLYDARSTDTRALEKPVPFRDHVVAVLAREPRGAAAFFAELLSGVELPTPVPVMRADDPDLGRAHDELEARLPRSAFDALASLAREAGVTLNTVVQAAWAVVLARYAGAPSVVFGATRAGRHTVAGSESIVGLLINTVPVRADVRDEVTLRAFLKALRAQWIAMRPFEQTHLTEVREALDLRGNRPLFDTLLVFDTDDLDHAFRRRGGPWARRRIRRIAQTDVPLTLAAAVADTLLLRLEHDIVAMDRATAERMLAHVVNVMTAMPALLDRPLAELEVTNEPERDSILALAEGPHAALPEVGLHELVDRACIEHGARVALSAAGQKVTTYGELRARVAREAARLAAAGVEPGRAWRRFSSAVRISCVHGSRFSPAVPHSCRSIPSTRADTSSTSFVMPVCVSSSRSRRSTTLSPGSMSRVCTSIARRRTRAFRHRPSIRPTPRTSSTPPVRRACRRASSSRTAPS